MRDKPIDEVWQEFDERGEALPGRFVTKPQARAGGLHGAAHVWMWRGKGEGLEILLQQRAGGKHTWPNFYDISAAGHIDAGETPLEAALRETEEELGFTIKPENLRLLFVHRAHLIDETSGLLENEFQWVYGLRGGKTMEFTLDEQEAGGLKWCKRAAFERLTNAQTTDRIVPHGQAYFAELLKEIDRIEEKS